MPKTLPRGLSARSFRAHEDSIRNRERTTYDLICRGIRVVGTLCLRVGDQGFGSFRASVETSSGVDGTASLKVRMACEGQSGSEPGDDSGSPMHVEGHLAVSQQERERAAQRTGAEARRAAEPQSDLFASDRAGMFPAARKRRRLAVRTLMRAAVVLGDGS